VKLLAAFTLLFAGAAHAQEARPVIVVGPAMQAPSTTVGALPACNAASSGNVYLVTNALVPVLGATVVTGGAVSVLVRCNATNWLVGQ
jgi:hypothetical protein